MASRHFLRTETLKRRATILGRPAALPLHNPTRPAGGLCGSCLFAHYLPRRARAARRSIWLPVRSTGCVAL